MILQDQSGESQSLRFLRAFQLAVTVLPLDSLVARQSQSLRFLRAFQQLWDIKEFLQSPRRNPFVSLGHFNVFPLADLPEEILIDVAIPSFP